MIQKAGHSDPGFLGGINHYDKNGKKTGHSNKGFWDNWNHYDD